MYPNILHLFIHIMKNPITNFHNFIFFPINYEMKIKV